MRNKILLSIEQAMSSSSRHVGPHPIGARMNCTSRMPLCLGRCLGVPVLAVLLGHSSNVAPQVARAAADRVVRIQVCVPTKRIYFDDLQLDQLENHPNFTKYSKQQLETAPKTIRRVAPPDDFRVLNDPKVVRSYGVSAGEVLNRSGVYSAGSGFMPVRDATIANQPVYEVGYGYPAKDYIAISIRQMSADVGPGVKAPTYWFRLPATVPADDFSEWFPPISMESEPASTVFWHRLANRGDLPIHPVSGDPPKMRVVSIKSRQTHEDPTNDPLPALTTARLRLRTATSNAEFVYEFVAKTNEVIPNCD